MKDFDFKEVVQAITDAKPSHLALVSFLVLPLVMNYWLESLLKLVPTPAQELKYWWLAALVAAYLFCLIWLVIDNHRVRTLEVRRDQIVGRLAANEWTKMSFESARKALTTEASDAQILSTIEAFPKTLRYVRVKKKDTAGNYVLDSEKKQVYVHGVGIWPGSGESEPDSGA